MQKNHLIWLSLALLALCAAAHEQEAGSSTAATTSADLANECSNEIQGVTACLNFASGKQANPSKECCDSTRDTKEKKPQCLCFIVQQTHNGGSGFRSLGVQEARIIRLPTACQLRNASLSYCPGLLKLAPNSPDAAIFRNASSASAPSTSTTGGTPMLPAGGAGGSRDGAFVAGSLGIAFALFYGGLLFGPAVSV